MVIPVVLKYRKYHSRFYLSCNGLITSCCTRVPESFVRKVINGDKKVGFERLEGLLDISNELDEREDMFWFLCAYIYGYIAGAKLPLYIISH